MLGEVVDLDHHAVDLVLNLVSTLTPVLDSLADRGQPRDPAGVVRDRQPPGLHCQIRVVQRIGTEALRVAQTVADHPKRTPGGDGRILLSQRPGRAVARIGKRCLTVLDQTGIQVREIRDHEEHLAPNLQHRWDREFLCPGECLGNITDGAGIERDVLTDATIPTGGGALQSAVAIDQRDRHAVDLQFAQVVRIRAQLVLHADRPGCEFLGVEHIVEAQHAFKMLGRCELSGKAGTADELGGRVRHPKFRVALLECDEFGE